MVYLSVPTLHQIEAIETVLNAGKLNYQREKEAFFIHVEELETFLTSLHKIGFHQLEKDGIRLFPVFPKESEAVAALKRMKSLSDWEAFYRCLDLIDILEARRLKVMFQPVIDLKNDTVFGYEALIRGLDASGNLVHPITLFEQAKQTDLLFYLDRLCRETIIEIADKKGIQEKLFINFIPTSIYDPEKCLKTTDAAIAKSNLSPEQVVFEVVESEYVHDYEHLSSILNYYRGKGYSTAVDDLGAGYADASSLLALKPVYAKIDRSITHKIHRNPVNQVRLQDYLKLADTYGIIPWRKGWSHRRNWSISKRLGFLLPRGITWEYPKNRKLKCRTRHIEARILARPFHRSS